MRKRLLLPILFLLGAGLIFYGWHEQKLSFIEKSNSAALTSPLPQLLTQALPQVLGASNEYFKPKVNHVLSSKVKKPDLTALSVISYDLSTDTLIYAKNIDKRLPIASLTKIMTATVALENSKLDKEFKVSHAAANIGEDSMGLGEGEVLPLSDLIYGLVLNSGNDAAEVIAEGSPFGRDNFVYLMNRKAEYLGLTNTHFTNPSGLEGDGNQYSTATDLLVMTRYALEKPFFAQAASTYQHDIDATGKHKEYHLYNETNLLTSYPGVKGVKTGYTYEAGLCLVTYLDYDGHRIIAILLNAQNRREEMKELLDYSLKSIGVTPPAHQ